MKFEIHISNDELLEIMVMSVKHDRFQEKHVPEY
jgi:hypothetical protein